jgi:murein L,D-transpeptidase YcbB/YkuD
MIMKRTGLLLIAQTLLMAWLAGTVAADAWRWEAAGALRQILQPALVGQVPDSCPSEDDLCRAISRFYRHRDYRPAWVEREGLLPEGAIALTALHRAGFHGLRAVDYDDPWMDDLLDGVISRPVILGTVFDGQQIRLDLVLTELILRYAFDRSVGRTAPDLVGSDRPDRAALCPDLAVALADALDEGRLGAFLAALGPRHRAFKALQRRLPHYQQIAAAGGWPTVDEGPPLQRGDCGPRVVQLWHRLAAAGDGLAASAGTCFDLHLEAAVRHFQQRHGLRADGVVGEDTLAALNVPVEARLRQIQINLERWRWMPAQLGPRYLLVNIPAFEMEIVQAGRVVETLRTIVGRKDRPTPMLTGAITYLELNPYWHVPPKIAREDLLPKIQANPEFLARQHFHVFDSWAADAREIDPRSIDWSSLSGDHFPFRLRQAPVRQNALGQVKFMFPNEQSVYIHDTPGKRLFERSSRPFSSGCVRVQEPLVLADFLLAGQGWDQSRLSQTVASAQRQVVLLEKPVPVYLVYHTAWVAQDGDVHFADDIYGHDQRLGEALAARPPARPACSALVRQATYLGRL